MVIRKVNHFQMSFKAADVYLAVNPSGNRRNLYLSFVFMFENKLKKKMALLLHVTIVKKLENLFALRKLTLL